MPRLSARAYAEMLNLPAYEQVRILYEQKYPKQQPQSFKIPYYLPALRGIKSYYRSGNSKQELSNARIAAKSLKLPSRCNHNLRVIDAFEKGPQSTRMLQLSKGARLQAQAAPNVEIRLQFDVEADEGNRRRRIFYNFRDVRIDPAIARTTLEIAYWILNQNGIALPIRALEYIDIGNGAAYRISRVSPRTVRLVRANGKIIAALWPTI